MQLDVLIQQGIPCLRVRLRPAGRKGRHDLFVNVRSTIVICDTHSIYGTVRLVSVVKPRRREYVEQTRIELVAAAEDLFCRDGFHNTSLDAVAAAARFTKGAVYRHFADKRALFVAVFERVQLDAMASLPKTEDAADPWQAAMSALEAFLDVCTAPRYRRIVLEEGPAVLGWSGWRELDERFAGQLLEQLLTALMDAGEIAVQPRRDLARLCCAVVGEAVLLLAESDDPSATKTQVLKSLGDMFGGLRIPR